jgi:hypothetical protein
MLLGKNSMHRISSSRVGLLIALLILGVFAGCGGSLDPNEAIAKVNSNNLQRLANLYFTYQMKNDWRGPADEAKFKEFIRGYNAKKLTRIGIDANAIDELFINERDGQPFKIRIPFAAAQWVALNPSSSKQSALVKTAWSDS